LRETENGESFVFVFAGFVSLLLLQFLRGQEAAAFSKNWAKTLRLWSREFRTPLAQRNQSFFASVRSQKEYFLSDRITGTTHRVEMLKAATQSCERATWTRFGFKPRRRCPKVRSSV
jgi:hypothetical protein